MEEFEKNYAENSPENTSDTFIADETPTTVEPGVEELSAEQLQAELAHKTAELEEYNNRLLRLQADFENFRRRTRQEKEDIARYALEQVMGNLLPVLDNFERATAAARQAKDVETVITGVEMIFRGLRDALTREGLEVIEAVGCNFDPNCHEAIAQIESAEHANNTIVEEFQKGYTLKGKVIRPAMVKVAAN